MQYIDARDLAAWLLSASRAGLTGTFNAVSRPGHTTMGELLDACIDAVGSDARLSWLSPELLQELGVTGWNDLPIWVPPSGEMAGLHGADVSAAHDSGLVCRSVEETCPSPRLGRRRGVGVMGRTHIAYRPNSNRRVRLIAQLRLLRTLCVVSSTSAETGQTEKLADARKNIAAILDAATACLAVNPDASINDIAAAAGVGRVTLYGHFANRATLVSQVVDRAMATSDAELEVVGLDGDAREALSRLLVASWHVTHPSGWARDRRAGRHAGT